MRMKISDFNVFLKEFVGFQIIMHGGNNSLFTVPCEYFYYNESSLIGKF